MFRILLILTIMFTTSMSWALDWNICYDNLESLRKMSRTETDASQLAAASQLAVKLRDVYGDIQTQRFVYDQCKNASDGTLYCVYAQLKMNTFIYDYKTERNNFNNLMLSFGKYAPSKSEACGYNLN